MNKKRQLLNKIGWNCKKMRKQIGYTQNEMSKNLNEIFDINTTYKLFSHFENGESDNLIIFLCYLEMTGRQGLAELLRGVNLDKYWYLKESEENERE